MRPVSLERLTVSGSSSSPRPMEEDDDESGVTNMRKKYAVPLLVIKQTGIRGGGGASSRMTPTTATSRAPMTAPVRREDQLEYWEYASMVKRRSYPECPCCKVNDAVMPYSSAANGCFICCGEMDGSGVKRFCGYTWTTSALTMMPRNCDNMRGLLAYARDMQQQKAAAAVATTTKTGKTKKEKETKPKKKKKKKEKKTATAIAIQQCTSFNIHLERHFGRLGMACYDCDAFYDYALLTKGYHGEYDDDDSGSPLDELLVRSRRTSPLAPLPIVITSHRRRTTTTTMMKTRDDTPSGSTASTELSREEE
jgi:hypothetical protein